MLINLQFCGSMFNLDENVLSDMILICLSTEVTTLTHFFKTFQNN